MFESRQFLETLSSFQQLLREGIFDMPCMGVANTKYRILRRLLLSSFAKSKWIEHYQQNKVCNSYFEWNTSCSNGRLVNITFFQDAERKKTDYSVQEGLQISVRHNQDHDFTGSLSFLFRMHALFWGSSLLINRYSVCFEATACLANVINHSSSPVLSLQCQIFSCLNIVLCSSGMICQSPP